MSIKMIGAALILAGSGGVGFGLAGNYLRQERAMEQLIKCLQWMRCQLQYAMPPLAHLCSGASKACTGPVSLVMHRFADIIAQNHLADVSHCMEAAICGVKSLPENAEAHLQDLGIFLGRFDLEGQLSELDATTERCKQELDKLRAEKETRTRTYQTLGLCAGAALVIILI